jgi:hypothetical protein
MSWGEADDRRLAAFMEMPMTKLALLSAGLITAAMLASPVAAREHHRVRHVAVDSDVRTAPVQYYANGPTYYPAPRVGAFATAPWDNGAPLYYPGRGYY